MLSNKDWAVRPDKHGGTLSIVVTGANRHDVSQLEIVLDEINIARPIYWYPSNPFQNPHVTAIYSTGY